MNWKLKAHSLAFLSRVPLGTAAYSAAKRLLGTNTFDFDLELRRACEIVNLVQEGGGNVEGSTVLEIGTGWRPFVPLVLSLSGAGRVITVDVNNWLTEPLVLETYRAIAARLPDVAAGLQLPAEVLQSRFDNCAPKSHAMAEILAAFRIEYRCPFDARQTGLDESSIDIVCSSNVLEHVPRQVLSEIHRESCRILKPGGLAVHRFNPQDHFVIVDRSICGANFLQYSERQWHWYGGSGLSFHNRLRCCQHRELFQAAGFATVVDRVRPDPQSAAHIEQGRLRVHPDFASLDVQELTADYMWYVGVAEKAAIGERGIDDTSRMLAHRA